MSDIETAIPRPETEVEETTLLQAILETVENYSHLSYEEIVGALHLAAHTYCVEANESDEDEEGGE